MTRLAAIAALAVGLTPGAAYAAVYGGAGQDGAPVTITVSKAGQLKKIGVAWTARCQSGQQYTYGGILVSGTKRQAVLMPGFDELRGGIRKNRLNASSEGALVFTDGYSGEVRQRIRGKLTPTYAAGTWSATIDVLDPGGSIADVCKTSVFRWSARRGPTVYGGSTTQGEPVVVEVSPSRTSVSYFGFAWDAECPGGSFRVSDALGAFPLTEGGALGKTWTDEYAFSDGTGKASFDYALAGTLRKGRGGGTISADYTETDTAGTSTLTCHTGTVRWNVTQ